MRVCLAGLKEAGAPVQPVASVSFTWSNCRPNEVIRSVRSVSGDVKVVVTPRPEKNDRKSTVGPSMAPLRPPAHSSWMTFLPPRSADWAMVSACNTPGSNAAVRLASGWVLIANVLLVEPVTPGHAPVAIVYQPAPVFGGAWVSMPSPRALTPFLRNFRIVGITPWSAYFSTRSWRMPSEAKKTALPGVESWDGWCPPPLWADAAGVPTARAATAAGATRARAAAMTTGRRSLRFTAPSKAGWEPIPQGPCCARARLPGDGSNLHPRSGGVKATLGYVPAAGGASSFRSRPAPTRGGPARRRGPGQALRVRSSLGSRVGGREPGPSSLSRSVPGSYAVG